jgi:hypothetical protein
MGVSIEDNEVGAGTVTVEVTPKRGYLSIRRESALLGTSKDSIFITTMTRNSTLGSHGYSREHPDSYPEETSDPSKYSHFFANTTFTGDYSRNEQSDLLDDGLLVGPVTTGLNNTIVITGSVLSVNRQLASLKYRGRPDMHGYDFIEITVSRSRVPHDEGDDENGFKTETYSGSINPQNTDTSNSNDAGFETYETRVATTTATLVVRVLPVNDAPVL